MRGTGWATGSSAMSSAAACCCTSSTAPASMPARPTRPSARELAAYGHGLDEKPEIVALSKVDALDAGELKEQIAAPEAAAKTEPLLVSAAHGKGVHGGPAGGCSGDRRRADGERGAVDEADRRAGDGGHERAAPRLRRAPRHVLARAVPAHRRQGRVVAAGGSQREAC